MEERHEVNLGLKILELQARLAHWQACPFCEEPLTTVFDRFQRISLKREIALLEWELNERRKPSGHSDEATLDHIQAAITQIQGERFRQVVQGLNIRMHSGRKLFALDPLGMHGEIERWLSFYLSYLLLTLDYVGFDGRVHVVAQPATEGAALRDFYRRRGKFTLIVGETESRDLLTAARTPDAFLKQPDVVVLGTTVLFTSMATRSAFMCPDCQLGSEWSGRIRQLIHAR